MCKNMVGLQPLRATQQKGKYISPQGSHNTPTNTDKALGTDKPSEGLSNAWGGPFVGPVQRRPRKKEQRHPAFVRVPARAAQVIRRGLRDAVYTIV